MPESLRWFPKISFSHPPSLLCSPATKVLRDSFDSHFPRATLRSNLYFSILSHSLARFYYSVNWFSSAILSFARLKSPPEDKKPEGGSAETRRETRRGEPRRRTVVPLFAFRTNSISSGFCLIANAAVRGKDGWHSTVAAATDSRTLGMLGVQNFVYKRYHVCATTKLHSLRIRVAYYRESTKCESNYQMVQL